jgi:hypothetical protein
MGLLDGGLAAIVGNALDFLLLDGTLRRETSTTVDEHGAPVATAVVTFAFRGFDDVYDAAYRARAGIPATDIKICIPAASLATTPRQDDKLTIRGVWYQARAVVSDPARALWEIQAFAIDTPVDPEED